MVPFCIINTFARQGISIVSIPFENYSMKSIGNVGNVGNNVGNRVGNNQVQNDVVSAILENDRVSAKAIAEQLRITTRTIERAIANLKAKGIIERVGSTRGKWRVKK